MRLCNLQVVDTIEHLDVCLLGEMRKHLAGRFLSIVNFSFLLMISDRSIIIIFCRLCSGQFCLPAVKKFGII